MPAYITVDNLPSAGFVYPKNVTVSYRSYSFGEVKVMSQIADNREDVFKLVSAGIEVTGMHKDKLTLADYLYIALLRKLVTTQAETFSVNWICAGCTSSNTTPFSYEEMEFRDLSVKMPRSVQLSSKLFKFSPLTIKQYMNLKAEDPVALLASCCVNHPYKTAHKALFDENDIIKVEALDDALDHMLLPLSCKCSTCAKSSKLDLLDG